MKSALALFALLPLVSPSVIAQPSPTQSGTAAPAASSTAAPAPASDTQIDAENACKKAALHRVAYEYCDSFAVLLSGNDKQKKEALTHIVDLTPDAVELANAYSIYKTESPVSEADQKAAINSILDKQISAPAAAGGSTSLVAKSIATNMLSVAVESGALTQSQSGNAITLQANPGNLFREAFLGTTDQSYLPKKYPFLESFTVSAALGTSTNSSIAVPTTGSATSSTVNTTNVLFNSSATKLSSLTVNYEINNKLSQRYIEKYLSKNKVQHLFIPPDTGTAPAVDKARATFRDDFEIEPASGCDAVKYSDLAASSGAVKDRIATFVTTFDDCFKAEMDTASDHAKAKGRTLDADWSAYNQALQADIASFQKSLKNQLSGWDASLQYVYNKPVGQPETHDFRFVGNGDLSKAAGSTWTANAAFSLYGGVPAGAQYGRLKDVQFSGEFDKSLGSKSASPSFSLAGYGQYQSKPSVLNITSSSVPAGVTLPANAQVFLAGTQGWLGVVQAKITLHVGSAAIPLAGKWSNRTDLLDKSKLGAQFGVSYDFSQLKQLIGLGSSNN